jgi:hypothetical protein
MRWRKHQDRIERMAADALALKSSKPIDAVAFVVRQQNRIPPEDCESQVLALVEQTLRRAA